MSNQPVIVGWDGSRGSREALEWAARQAERAQRPLRIAFVVNTPEQAIAMMPGVSTPIFSEDEIIAVLQPAKDLALQTAPDLQVETVSLTGHPVAALIEASHGARALVVGSHGHSRLYSAVLGSTSLSIASHCACPVIVVRGNLETEQNAPVVVGADGSKTAQAAVEYAARFASDRGAPLVAVCAMPQPSEYTIPDLVITPEYREELRHDAERFMSESLAGIAEDYPDLEIRKVVSDDTAPRSLVEVAKDAQLLVVGSRGHGGFTGMLLGSVSRSVLFHSPCPIAVVRGSE